VTEEGSPPYQPSAWSRWRRWVFVLLAFQSLLLVLVVVAIWPLIRASRPEFGQFQAQRPQKVSVRTEGQTPFPVDRSPGLTGTPACRLDGAATAYRAPCTWSWPRLRARLWDWQAVEVVMERDDPHVTGNAINCRGLIHRQSLLAVSSGR
jgi:hypothetical protein